MTDEEETPWHILRRKRVDRDGYRCVNCGAEKNLQVHHIVPKGAGGEDKLTNLRTLCRECHDTAHPDVNIPTSHKNPAETKWIPTVNSVRHLVDETCHPVSRLIILILAKTGIGVTELRELEMSDIYLRPGFSDLPSKTHPTEQPFILIEANDTGPGSGMSKRLCDTKVPLDPEIRYVLENYLAIRPTSNTQKLLLSTNNWGEEISQDSIHHIIEQIARDCFLYEDNAKMGENMSPQRLLEFFKYHFAGQPATKQYLIGRKEELPYPWPKLLTDYREGTPKLLG